MDPITLFCHREITLLCSQSNSLLIDRIEQQIVLPHIAFAITCSAMLSLAQPFPLIELGLPKTNVSSRIVHSIASNIPLYYQVPLGTFGIYLEDLPLWYPTLNVHDLHPMQILCMHGRPGGTMDSL